MTYDKAFIGKVKIIILLPQAHQDFPGLRWSKKNTWVATCAVISS